MKKYLILTMTLILTAMTAFAQNNDGRIPAKGYAVYEEKGHFKPYEFTRHMIYRLKSYMLVSATVICTMYSPTGAQRNIRWFPSMGMLDYSVKNNIYPEVEVIEADGKQIDEAYQNVLNGKVKFRYVIDMKTLK